jgi:hypothetical protein
LTTLVDICVQEGASSPFQAESANVSGRGMHVRTSYLPEVGEELVCRLNHDDREILVEGRVAWRAEGQDSGEFGIQFTALDADSADILQSLGERVIGAQSSSPRATEALEDEEAEGVELFSEGARVKLHIEGLGAPMKACVHEGNTRKLRVGSALEFLKMGRGLQIEDVGEGARRGATVDTVNVVINPTTSVPELVVQLRYEGVSPTPPPAHVKKTGPSYEDVAFARASADDEDDLEAMGDLSEDDAAPWEPAAEALRARLGGAMKSASAAASKAGSVFGAVAQSARESVVQAAALRTRAPAKMGEAPSYSAAKRRQTTRQTHRVAPAHLRSGIHDLGLAGKKKVAPARVPRPEPVSNAKRRVPPAAVFGAAFVLFAGSALALRSFGSEKDVEATAPAAVAAPPTQTEVTAPQVASTAPVKKAVPTEDQVVAEVPLFGPQAMAVKPKEQEPEEGVDLAEAERRSAAAAVEDQTWDDAAAEAEVPQSKPWGKGTLYLPTIHRIRLDGVGAALSGAVNPDGFTVVIPGRKAMESGKTIQKRDKRIATVTTSNGENGATVKFEFRGAVPPYRVRLRQDFVEFLVSAPEDTVARL